MNNSGNTCASLSLFHEILPQDTQSCGGSIAIPEEKIFFGMVGKSRPMRTLFSLIQRLALLDIPVMIIGETGTGKELVARALHALSPRAKGPFFPINCAALAREIFESEFFGHERGAFTNAYSRKEGAFEAASLGTLFLDEIGELPLALQSKLLRAIELKEVRRIGSNLVTHTNARVITATNRDLRLEVESGHFREDLYYRISVMPVHLPPLRNRKEDIPLLAEHFLREASRDFITISKEAMEVLVNHRWPGNVRELKNVIERSVVFCTGTTIEQSHICQAIALGGALQSAENPKGLLEEMERRLITMELTRNQGNKKETARTLGIAKSTLFEKLKRYQIV